MLAGHKPERKRKCCWFVRSPWRPYASLCRLCEANLQVAIVKNGVVGSHKHIAQDPERTTGRRNVHSCETTDALGSRSRTNLKDILPSSTNVSISGVQILSQNVNISGNRKSPTPS
uniref:Uncharacterized protein n=1 Tax=Arundo donax TaxID=35708 RepID=A0A0A9CZE1_ARUDO